MFDNSKPGLVKIEQQSEGMLKTFTRLKNPDFGKVDAARMGSKWCVKTSCDVWLDREAARHVNDAPSPIAVSGTITMKMPRVYLEPTRQ